MRHFILAGALALACLRPALAQDCKPLQMLGSAKLEVSDSGVFIDVTVNGKPAKMRLSTAGGVTSFTPEGAAAMGLAPIADSRVVLISSNSKSSESYVVVDDLSVGGAHIVHSQYMILPPSESTSSEIVGMIGTDLLSHFDVEMDFANGKLNLFAQDHCPGKVIYWKHVAVSMVPMTEFQPTRNDSRTSYQGYNKRFEQMWVPVTLDGKPIPAQLSTSGESVMRSSTAKGSFGVDAGSPGSVPLPGLLAEDGYFEHIFDSLVFDGVTITHPHFIIRPNLDAKFARHFRRTDTRLARLDDGAAPQIVIGMSILSKLHLFASFGEHRLYITEAGTPAAP
jgi:predicted aspartyl protease